MGKQLYRYAVLLNQWAIFWIFEILSHVNSLKHETYKFTLHTMEKQPAAPCMKKSKSCGPY